MADGVELFIDFTFSKSLSVLVSKDDSVKHFISVASSEHVSKLLPLIVEDCIRNSGQNFSSLSGIYIANGPGSFTALRILVSYIKGIYTALSVPVYIYNSTDWMAYYILKNRKNPKQSFTIGFYSGAKNFYYLSEYIVKDGVPKIQNSRVVECGDNIDFSDNDIEKELGAKYLFYLHLVKAPESVDVEKLQPNYLFSEILQISK
ncbi:MAG: tRNA (adenosine(37)-N6)-threonylcarbamoyltransferase complex dimerization subunit type 1 TsaB [Candidatus Calescibacterium sp.]|nr:tRNA (adenosine(37)-N6)-threonylcarbamoyltransferase complex dimerization subunit type 1 TsaB [Candidatus Calescibacterium sp.]MCX7734816.1 tRNA (adenosine(37)-N6)-threonylcarbamoyltransferase complex dimerization subunit type 1 TsaB [bacterium]MDW8087728.1 tRNA (adenosine(37)-N6)-threonylcarbamoyltransferase complex dimerization subunit type 1 TsaB [Candidatus Calescibacterium sp.]